MVLGCLPCYGLGAVVDKSTMDGKHGWFELAYFIGFGWVCSDAYLFFVWLYSKVRSLVKSAETHWFFVRLQCFGIRSHEKLLGVTAHSITAYEVRNGKCRKWYFQYGNDPKHTTKIEKKGKKLMLMVAISVRRLQFNGKLVAICKTRSCKTRQTIQ